MHAVHAIGDGPLIDGGAEDPCSVKKVAGSDRDAARCNGGNVDELGWGEPDSALLGTPQRAHIRAAAGLSPGGLR